MRRDYSRGMHWVGHPGSLVPVTDYGTVSVDDLVEPQLQPSLGGGVRARVPRGRPKRAWSLSVPDAHADDVSSLRSLVTATLPPYVLVTAEAQVSNVLTPERSVMAGSGLGMAGGWPLDGGGHTAITHTNPGAAFGNQAPVSIGPCPTPPSWTGRAVTVSAWLGTARPEGARVSVRWLDAAGSSIGLSQGSHVTGMDVLRRSTYTAVPPSGTVAIRMGFDYAELIAQPQVTWTDHPIEEWSPGNGADMVVVTGLSRDTEFAVPDQYGLRRSSYDIGFQEVGP